MQAITVFMSLNICLYVDKQGLIINQCVISKANVLSHSYYCCQRVFACACSALNREERGKKKQQHVSMYEKISFPHMPGLQPASCSLRKKEGSFSALCPLWLHWGFSSQVTAFLSHVLAEQCAGTFHQSAGWDGSSGIILTVGPSQDEIRGCLADRHTHPPQLREILFHHHYYYSNHNHVPSDGMQKIYIYLSSALTITLHQRKHARRREPGSCKEA